MDLAAICVKALYCVRGDVEEGQVQKLEKNIHGTTVNVNLCISTEFTPDPLGLVWQDKIENI